MCRIFVIRYQFINNEVNDICSHALDQDIWRHLYFKLKTHGQTSGILWHHARKWNNKWYYSNQLDGTHRLWSHADDWLHHLANVNEARTKHLQSWRWLVMSPSKCRWIAVLVCKMNLLTLWPFNPLTAKCRIYPVQQEYCVRQLPDISGDISLEYIGTWRQEYFVSGVYN